MSKEQIVTAYKYMIMCKGRQYDAETALVWADALKNVDIKMVLDAFKKITYDSNSWPTVGNIIDEIKKDIDYLIDKNGMSWAWKKEYPDLLKNVEGIDDMTIEQMKQIYYDHYINNRIDGASPLQIEEKK
jgi:hypothetical protein